MGLHISKTELATNEGLRKQHASVVQMRKANDLNEQAVAERNGLETNAARLPGSVWLDFDNTVKQLMLGEEGETLLNDLMPLARNVHIGKIVSEYRRITESELEVRSSIDGQHSKPVNHTSFDYDGALVLVHSTQVGRVWRELEGERSEGYDPLRDDQAVAVRYVRKRTVDNFVNGTADLTYKGYSAFGITNNPNTLALDLGAAGLNIDLTSPSTTYEQFRTVFVTALQTMTGKANAAVGNVTFYISEEIWFNMMRTALPGTTNLETIADVLGRTPGIAGFKQTNVVTGNEFFAIILNSEYIRPIIGMPITTTPVPRILPMDDFHLLIWSASGLQIKSDGSGRSGVLYASAA